ncbi:MAG TPA: hypothetical protein VIJ88_00160 [Candidatus Paceibacterota bacterium]
MDPKEKSERRKIAAEVAKIQLAEKTWPQVMAVFEYSNPRAPQKSDEEFSRIKNLLEKATCINMAAFIDMVQFEEKRCGVTKSFNLSLCKRLTPGEAPSPTINAMLSCPDILVGTRNGVEGAMDWFNNFSKGMTQLAPESIQIFDKIFGEAVDVLAGPTLKAAIGEMLQFAITGEGVLFKTPDIPSKH